MFFEFRELMKDNLFRGVVLFVIFIMFASVVIGWQLNKNITAWENRRKTIEQSTTVNLTVTKKGIENQFIFGLPTRCYIILSDESKIYISPEEYGTYELNDSYYFEQIEEMIINRKIRPYKNVDE